MSVNVTYVAVGRCIVYLSVLVLAGVGGGGNFLFERSAELAPTPSPRTPSPGEVVDPVPVDPLAGMPNSQGLWNVVCPKADGVVKATKALFVLTMLGVVASAGSYVYLAVVAGKKRRADAVAVAADVVLVLTMVATLFMFSWILVHECTASFFIITDSLAMRHFDFGFGFIAYIIATIAVGLLSCFSCGSMCCTQGSGAQVVEVPNQAAPAVYPGNPQYQAVPTLGPVAYPQGCPVYGQAGNGYAMVAMQPAAMQPAV